MARPGAIGRRVEIGTATRSATVFAMDSPPPATAVALFKLPRQVTEAMKASRLVEMGGHVQLLPLPRVRQAPEKNSRPAKKPPPAKKKKKSPPAKKKPLSAKKKNPPSAQKRKERPVLVAARKFADNAPPKRHKRVSACADQAPAPCDACADQAPAPCDACAYPVSDAPVPWGDRPRPGHRVRPMPVQKARPRHPRVRPSDMKPPQRFVCDCEFEGGVRGLALCVVLSEPDGGGDFACYTYKAAYPNTDTRWVRGKHHAPQGRERVPEVVNVRSVVVLVAELLKNKTFPQAVVSAIETHPAYHRMGKKAAPEDESEDEEDAPLGVRVGLSRSVSA